MRRRSNTASVHKCISHVIIRDVVLLCPIEGERQCVRKQRDPLPCDKKNDNRKCLFIRRVPFPFTVSINS